MKERLEELVNKWIKREIELRKSADSSQWEAQKLRYEAVANELSNRRRELQEAAGLVVMP